MRNINLIIFCFFAFIIETYSQSDKIDSLKKVIKTAQHDSIHVNALKAWDDMIYFNDAEKDHDLLLEIAQICRQNLKKKLLKSREKKFYELKLAWANNGLGLLSENKGNYPEALQFHFAALKLREKWGVKKEISGSYNNIGNIYMLQRNSKDALVAYFKVVAFLKDWSDKREIGYAYANIGNVYTSDTLWEEAFNYLNKGLKLLVEAKDIYGEANLCNNIGSVYKEKREFKESLPYFERALMLFEKVGYKRGIATASSNIGFSLFHLGKIKEAKENHLKANALAKEVNLKTIVRNSYEGLAEIARVSSNFEEAYKNFRLYVLYRDSLLSEENTRKTVEQQMQYGFDKKSAADSVANAKQKLIQKVEIARQDAELKAKRNQQYLLFGGLTLVIIFAIFMYNRFRVTRTQKNIIEMQKGEVEVQKEIIEEKHKEITDSINYAERIQRTFLSTKEKLDTNLGEYFILFKPKDVVSGDFYWSEKLSDGNFVLAAADSTGHGVPGAIMSLLNITCLENSVKEGFTQPDEILNHTRTNIIERLKKDGSLDGGKDGMDCSVLCFDETKTKLTFSLANNPLWLMREGELIEFRPDKMPVGKHDKQHLPFTKHELLLQKEDVIYIFTDGYADQFGGEKGKKFKYSNLQKLLIDNSGLSMNNLKEKLTIEFEEWKGDLEQIDDVCVVGIRI